MCILAAETNQTVLGSVGRGSGNRASIAKAGEKQHNRALPLRMARPTLKLGGQQQVDRIFHECGRLRVSRNETRDPKVPLA